MQFDRGEESVSPMKALNRANDQPSEGQIQDQPVSARHHRARRVMSTPEESGLTLRKLSRSTEPWRKAP